MKKHSYVSIKFPSNVAEEDFILATVEPFIQTMEPSIIELDEITSAIWEGVQNARDYAYPNSTGNILIKMTKKSNNQIEVKIQDWGIGISDIEQATQPFCTTSREGSGLGFTIMQSFMDNFQIKSRINFGTTIIMRRKIRMH